MTQHQYFFYFHFQVFCFSEKTPDTDVIITWFPEWKDLGRDFFKKKKREFLQKCLSTAVNEKTSGGWSNLSEVIELVTDKAEVLSLGF